MGPCVTTQFHSIILRILNPNPYLRLQTPKFYFGTGCQEKGELCLRMGVSEIVSLSLILPMAMVLL